MERRATAFFLIQILLSATTSGTALGRPRPASSTSGQPRHAHHPSLERHRRSPSQSDYFPFLTDRRGIHVGGGGGARPVFGSPNLRSIDNVPPDPDRYWDFVLGSGTFRRRSGNIPEEEYRIVRRRKRREATAAASDKNDWPIFDVLGRRMKGGKDRTDGETSQTPAAAEEATCKDKKADRWEVGKKSDEMFFPSTSGDNHDFYDFLLGEHGR